MRLLRACYDWRVIAALAAVGLGVYLAAPRLVATVLPLFLLAVCPLSMLLMARSMGSHQAGDAVTDAAEQDPATLRRELAAIARHQTRLTAQLEALEDRDRLNAAPIGLSTDGPRTPMGPERRTGRSR